jgi:hypothetical protein
MNTHSDLDIKFTAGDKIVCIDAKPRGHESPDMLEKLEELSEGITYTVAEAYDWRKARGSWSLVLKEIASPFPLSWNSDRFTHA